MINSKGPQTPCRSESFSTAQCDARGQEVVTQLVLFQGVFLKAGQLLLLRDHANLGLYAHAGGTTAPIYPDHRFMQPFNLWT
jgi:hypothetical protein